MPTDTFLVTKQAPSGNPPPIPLAIGTISGATYSPDGGGCVELRKSGDSNFGLIIADGPFSLRQADQVALTVCSWTGGLDMSKSNNTIAGAWANTASSGWSIALNETEKDGNRPVPAVLVSDGADGSDSEASTDLSTGFTFTTSQGDSDRYKIIVTNTNKWSEWLKVKERLAIAIKEIVERNKASFAFPSQSIYVEKK